MCARVPRAEQRSALFADSWCAPSLATTKPAQVRFLVAQRGVVRDCRQRSYVLGLCVKGISRGRGARGSLRRPLRIIEGGLRTCARPAARSLDAACGRAALGPSLHRPDKPHGSTFIRFLPTTMNPKTSVSTGLQHFRVWRHWTETYTVDVIAHDSCEALELADKLDLGDWRIASEGWRDERADRLPYDQFEQPDLPASAWTAPPRKPTHRETALSAISPTLQ